MSYQFHIPEFVTGLVCLLTGIASTANAQTVDARLSSREAYVGQPIVLQIAISDASDSTPPTIPEIDGCEIQSAGAPSQSSQITIINGRRSERRSVTTQYLITPRREGTFEIPPLAVKVNGATQMTQTLTFVATKSETGDLLFVEIEGKQKEVYVGQPLDLKLKIWIKPFVDRERNITLSEGDMWQMVSEQTRWGSFEDRLQELAANRQRPGGQEVLRDDGTGQQRSYYLYEIEAKTYPKRPGQIAADDVQIVVNYPTALGRSRDPFDSFFDDSLFGNSRMRQMMQDDFFGSPFGNRLSVTAARPIIGEASVDSTNVLPIPSEGRPADYRGAVGQYQIVTQVNPTHVSAGDPITLQIGIAGTGPMELVQAPPLAELSELTKDFKVEDQALAGFVRENTKVFPTTIRPRQAGITEVPAIPFSYFDPETATFHTIHSDPISITVDEAESLALDAIQSNARPGQSPQNEKSSVMTPDFTNIDSESLLVSQQPGRVSNWWMAFVVVPPLVWLSALVMTQRHRLRVMERILPANRSRSLKGIQHAQSREQIDRIMTVFVVARTNSRVSFALSSPVTPAIQTRAVGSLRLIGLYQLAAQLESLFATTVLSNSLSSGVTLEDYRQRAEKLITEIDSEIRRRQRDSIRRSSKLANPSKPKPTGGARSAAMLVALAVLPLSVLARGVAPAESPTARAESDATTHQRVFDDAPSIEQLTEQQKQALLTEATSAYKQALSMAERDQAEANLLYSEAARKYQLLVDSGIQNSELYFNLGNAYFKSHQLGRAIVNYEKARTLTPYNPQIAINLNLANSLLKSQATTLGEKGEALSAFFRSIRQLNIVVASWLGISTILVMLCMSSVLFWGLLTVNVFRPQWPLRRLAIAPLLVLAITAGSMRLSAMPVDQSQEGVLVVDDIVLRLGDGQEFEEVAKLQEADGQRVRIITQRGDWLRVETANEQVGWIPSAACERTSLPELAPAS